MDLTALVPSGIGYNAETIQLLVTLAVATFDIVVVWFGVWIPLRRSVAPEDRPFLWTGIAGYAKANREEHDRDVRMRGAYGRG